MNTNSEDIKEEELLSNNYKNDLIINPKECPYCNLIISSKEYSDHLLCHEIDQNENPNSEFNVNNYAITSNPISSFNNNNKRPESYLNYNSIIDNIRRDNVEETKKGNNNFFDKISNFWEDIVNKIKKENNNSDEDINNENTDENISNDNNYTNINSYNYTNNYNNLHNLRHRRFNDVREIRRPTYFSNNRNRYNYRNNSCPRMPDGETNNNYQRFFFQNRQRSGLFINEDEDDLSDLSVNFSDDENVNENNIKNILKYIPTSKIKIVNKNNENSRCVICLEDFVIDDEVSTLQCLHLFHQKCIEKWIKKKLWCPICKYEISVNSLLNGGVIEDNL